MRAEDIEDVLNTIDLGYLSASLHGRKAYVCQLCNNDRGFSPEDIKVIKIRVKSLRFDIPTHISILPAGKKASSLKLYDGLTGIYCNSVKLKAAIAEMKKQVI